MPDVDNDQGFNCHMYRGGHAYDQYCDPASTFQLIIPILDRFAANADPAQPIAHTYRAVSQELARSLYPDFVVG